MDDEKELIQKCIDGDRYAMKQIFQKHFGKTMTICLRYIDGNENAQDIAQEVMIKVFDHIKEFKFQSSLSTWVTRIAINQCINFINKKNIFVSIEDQDIYPENIYIEEEEIKPEVNSDYIIELIQKLPTGYRTVLNLYAIENYTHNQIAQTLGISEGTSKSQLSKARQMLKKLVSNHTPTIVKTTSEKE